MNDIRPSTRWRIEINGIVQGVGFRPFVFRLAGEHSLVGKVENNPEGVSIEIQGAPEQLVAFLKQLKEELPPQAMIDSCEYHEIPLQSDNGFIISKSSHTQNATTLISPDIATCPDCLKELFDPKDRRYKYPFINCTNCGPRYTIVENLPYDRPFTSMKEFDLCTACRQEYEDPSDRRFHAQPNACHKCGPSLSVCDNSGRVQTDDPIALTVEALVQGRIVAMRGLGGFHLVVDATNEQAVSELRRRKRRFEKPLAMMAPDLDAIHDFCHLAKEDEKLLLDFKRPIVLIRRREKTQIAPSVVYDNHYFGFMLPYTPLHHLILRDNFKALIMTSGNVSEEPICIDNREAMEHLRDIADLFLLHNREILQRCDDSIVRNSSSGPQIIRRARGYVPFPIYLNKKVKAPILACGGELKNTVALAAGKRVFLSQHIGDLDNPTAMSFFEETVKHLKKTLEIEPELIACDLHPEYLSTKYALRQPLPFYQVQHHHAHLASVLADNKSGDRAIGLILDGTGYGSDGTIWGGELLIGNAREFERYAWLEPTKMPGGTAAIKQPWRMALSYLHKLYSSDISQYPQNLVREIGTEKIEQLLLVISKSINSPLTSSCGRLFDAVSAMLGICYEANYEAQAAILLEMAAHGSSELTSHHQEYRHNHKLVGALSVDKLIEDVVQSLNRAESVDKIASRFHLSLANLWISAVKAARVETGINSVALSGGVFQNLLFFEYLFRRLNEEDFEVLIHRQLPTNDGGLALGQIAVAAANQ